MPAWETCTSASPREGVGTDTPSENESWSEMARAMGAEAIVVDRLEDVGPALKKATDMQMNEGKTCVIEIMCTRELGDPFRRDALALPTRHLAKYKATAAPRG